MKTPRNSFLSRLALLGAGLLLAVSSALAQGAGSVAGSVVSTATRNALQGAVVSFRFYNKQGNPVGMLSLVGSDAQGQNAGILALVQANLAGILKPASASQVAQLAKVVQ